jgi:hypothetical protein
MRPVELCLGRQPDLLELVRPEDHRAPVGTKSISFRLTLARGYWAVMSQESWKRSPSLTVPASERSTRRVSRPLAVLAPDVEWHRGPTALDRGVLKDREAVIRYFVGVWEAGDWQVKARGFIDAGETRRRPPTRACRLQNHKDSSTKAGLPQSFLPGAGTTILANPASVGKISSSGS